MANAGLADAARTELKDANQFLFFEGSGTVLASSSQANTAELKPIAETLTDRDEAIKRGIVLYGTRYEVHKHHPPLVYGRTMQGSPETSEGIALCKIDAPAGPRYGVITYQMPNVSARMVPLLQEFCQKHLSQ